MTDFSSLTVLVLAGGISHERDISLRSGRMVADNLAAQGVTVVLRDLDVDLLSQLESTEFHVVWPALHGAAGEDGSLRGLLDLSSIPYVGSRTAPTRLAWDKPTSKTLVSRSGVNTPEWITLSRDSFRDLGAPNVLAHLGVGMPGSVVVKPSQGGSAQGVTIVEDSADLASAMVHAYRYGDSALVEKRIVGTELSVCVIDTGGGPVALPAVEIVPRDGFFSFEARYNAGETRFYTPARISTSHAEGAADAAIRVFRALGLRDLCRVDFIVDAEGTPWFLEASIMPGLTETSVFPEALEAAGYDVGSVFAALCREASLRTEFQIGRAHV